MRGLIIVMCLNKELLINDELFSEKNRLRLCVLATFFFGLIGHAYRFFSGSYSHDSLDSIYADSSEFFWKISLGRFFAPVVMKLRGNIALPWLIGFVSILFIAFSVWFVVRTLDIESKILICLLSGIMVTNITVTATVATYLHDLDIDMLALLLSTLAAFLIMKKDKIGWYALSAVMIMVSLGLYQSYIEVALIIVIIAFLKRLLDGVNAKNVILHGLKAITTFISGGIAYFVLYKIVCNTFGIVAQERTNIHTTQDFSIIISIKTMIYKIVETFINPVSFFSSKLMGWVNLILIVSSVVLCMILIFRIGKKKTAEKVVAILLLSSFPIAVNAISIAVNGELHELMIYSFWFIYIFSLLIIDITYQNNKDSIFFECIKGISLVLASIVLLNNIVISNTAYLKKDLESIATVSTLTRVVEDLENRNDYKVGETEISFVGVASTINTMPGFEFLTSITGLRGSGSISQSGISDHYNLYKAFFNYYLNYPINYSKKDYSKDVRVLNMPSYPENGYIKNIDGIIVVKMG